MHDVILRLRSVPLFVGLATLGALTFAVCSVANAQACDQPAFASAVSEANAVLTGMNERNRKELHEKLESLKLRSGWSNADFMTKAATLVKDDQTAEMDDRNRTILGDVSKLGAGETLNDRSRCAMLDRLKALLSEVVQNTDQKWRHIHQKADASINSAGPGFATANSIK